MYKIVIILIFALLVAIFAISNSNPLTLVVPFVGGFETTQAVVIICAVLVGALIMFLVVLFTKARKSWQTRGEKKASGQESSLSDEAVNQLKQENAELMKTNEELTAQIRKLEGMLRGEEAEPETDLQIEKMAAETVNETGDVIDAIEEPEVSEEKESSAKQFLKGLWKK